MAAEKAIASLTGKVHESPQLQLRQDEGIYLFCFARRGAIPAIEGPGLDNQHPVKEWTFKDVTAVLSKVNLSAWTGPATEESLQELGRFLPRFYRHQEVIEQVMQYSPVLPARFATLFSSLERLKSLLESHYHRISSFLDYVADKEEWGVKGLLDKTKAKECFFPSDSMFSFFPLSPGARYLMEQRLQAEAAKKLKSWSKLVSEAIAQKLTNHAVDSRKLRTLPREAQETKKDVVFDRVFLLYRETREDFQNLVKRISADHSPRGLTLEACGPSPPYSFCPDLTRPNEKLLLTGRERCTSEK